MMLDRHNSKLHDLVHSHLKMCRHSPDEFGRDIFYHQPSIRTVPISPGIFYDAEISVVNSTTQPAKKTSLHSAIKMSIGLPCSLVMDQ